MNEAWLCPRCRKINAPWLPQCTCIEQKPLVVKDGKITLPSLRDAEVVYGPDPTTNIIKP